MKTLVIYDSLHGNTEKVARAIGEGIAQDVEVISIKDAGTENLSDYELVVFGAPTHGGRPKPEAKAFLDKIPPGALKNVKVAAFDTRAIAEKQKFLLKLLIGMIGYAAPKIAKSLTSKGGSLPVEPEGFFVEDTKGPLKEGELERARKWGEGLGV
ncbi:MAG: flavodoxin family protein [Patescibacteria group bacterium]|nr:flavodoxin family protein [Patescibacteria group bacterium]